MAFTNTTGSAGSTSRSAPQLLLGTPTRVLFSLTLIAGLLAVLINAVYAQDSGTPAATPNATPSAEMPRVELTLEEVNESDLGGKVTLYEFGDSTIVEFAATGAGGDHPAVIVPGVCGEPSDTTAFDLEPVSNTGESRTVVDAKLEDLLADDYSVQIRMSQEGVDTVIACATIEGEPGLESAATPAASPAATPSASPEASTEDGVGGSTTDIDGTSGATGVDAPTLTVKLVDWSETGVTGTAVLTGQDNLTRVNINIAGPGVESGHEVHIHNGTCTTPGSATYTLNPIEADGTSTTTVNLSIDQLTQGGYFINVHPDEANWDNWMVCGNITGTPTSLVNPTATVTPGSELTQTSDGSTGGNTTLVTTNAQASAFPDTVGVGDGLRWPSDTRTAVVWALGGGAIMMLSAGLILRHGERSGKQPRFTRLGL